MKLISIIFGVALVGVGLVVLPMPIPLGAIMIACGLVLLISASSTVAHAIRGLRRRHPGANRVIQSVEDRLPEAWKKALRRSDP